MEQHPWQGETLTEHTLPFKLSKEMTDINQALLDLKVNEGGGSRRPSITNQRANDFDPSRKDVRVDQPGEARMEVKHSGGGNYTYIASSTPAAPVINIEGDAYDESTSLSAFSNRANDSGLSSSIVICEKIVDGGQVGFRVEGNQILDSTSEVAASYQSITKSDTDSESRSSSLYGSANFENIPTKHSKSKGLGFVDKLVGALHLKSKKQAFKSKLPLDQYISKLKDSNGKYEESCCIPVEDIEKICREARELTMSQPVLLELQPPLQICGDIHGQFPDLITLFDVCGDPSNSNYLFLGDYVDRGKQSIETILLLMCYKLKYPETFFLLRGNHECADVNRMYGFFDECKRRSKMKMWKEFTTYFDTLPLAAVIAEKIFCVHGGLSPTLHSMDSIREVKRPCHIGSRGVEADLLWSDPAEGVVKWELNEDRGVSFVFGREIIDSFLAKFNYELIVRAHMVVEDGYEFFHGRKLVTIFTAPNYCGDFDNKGAIMNIDPDLQISFKFLVPAIKTKINNNGSNSVKKNARGV